MREQPSLSDGRPTRNAPVWLKFLVAFHLMAITIWALPARNDDQRAGTDYLLWANQTYLKSFKPVSAYLFITGFWQYWDMFSPNPAQTDIWLDADVVYKDGSVKHYDYPRIYNLPLFQKFLKERYRKFNERVNQESYSYLWPVVGQAIAHLADNPANPPTIVRLTRHWLQIVPPGVKQPTEYSSYLYYQYVVDQKVLKQARTGPL